MYIYVHCNGCVPGVLNMLCSRVMSIMCKWNSVGENVTELKLLFPLDIVKSSVCVILGVLPV